MKTNVYSVFDVKAAAFGVPFFCPKDGMAVRMFERVVNDQATMVSQNPGDFSLYRIGLFDDDTAVLESTKPEVVVMAAQLVRSPVTGGNRSLGIDPRRAAFGITSSKADANGAVGEVLK